MNSSGTPPKSPSEISRPAPTNEERAMIEKQLAEMIRENEIDPTTITPEEREELFEAVRENNEAKQRNQEAKRHMEANYREYQEHYGRTMGNLNNLIERYNDFERRLRREEEEDEKEEKKFEEENRKVFDSLGLTNILRGKEGK